MSIKVGDIYYIETLLEFAILKRIKTSNVKYLYRFSFLLSDGSIQDDYPCEKKELDNKILVNNPINKLLYPEYVEKGDFLYEKDIDANFTLNDYYKLRNAYNEGQS
jgi:hypothetical protein